MKLLYKEFISHITAEIDLSKDRDDAAETMCQAACSQFNRRRTDGMFAYFRNDSGMYHAVRDLIETIETNDFNDVLKVFKEIYPQLSYDWKCALKTGLSIKAGKLVNNTLGMPYVYNDRIAQEIRQLGLNMMWLILPEILTDPKCVEDIQSIIYQFTQQFTTISKNTGSMKNYTRFKPRNGGRFDPSITAQLREIFPTINKEAGIYVDVHAIDILTAHIQAQPLKSSEKVAICNTIQQDQQLCLPY